jgi:hypothetical protein
MLDQIDAREVADVVVVAGLEVAGGAALLTTVVGGAVLVETGGAVDVVGVIPNATMQEMMLFSALACDEERDDEFCAIVCAIYSSSPGLWGLAGTSGPMLFCTSAVMFASVGVQPVGRLLPNMVVQSAALQEGAVLVETGAVVGGALGVMPNESIQAMILFTDVAPDAVNPATPPA